MARQLCTPPWDATPWSTRAAALLTRQAVEFWLADYWTAHEPDVAVVSRKAQLLMLTRDLPEHDAADARALWEQLSRACHHRSFDLDPSIEQALVWISRAEHFGEALLQAAHAHAGPR